MKKIGKKFKSAKEAIPAEKQSKSEAFGMGEDEFVPWTVGALL